jgi:glyoxylase-like metal-dependent hydrolase (beta-lactamase superfamily II)
LHEFEARLAHPAEADRLARPEFATLITSQLSETLRDDLARSGYDLPEVLVDAIPHAGWDVNAYALVPAAATRLVGEGDAVDLGDRRLTVIHTPGHSPGGISLYEEHTGIFFSGDAVYDGPLLDGLDGSDIGAYVRTMRRLRELDVSIVHAGHDPSFGRARLVEICDAYLRSRGA